MSDLTVQYPGGGQGTPALAGVSIQVAPGETLAIVGESGAGKSTLAMAAIGRLPPQASIASGQVVVCGTDWSTLDDAGRRRMWRDVVKFVPQQPGPALNPSMTIGRQVAEVLAGGRETGRGHGDPAVARALAGVGLADPRRVAKAYPHQLSGGMQQRVMIAMALARDPQLLVLDEPTTALDVTTEAAMLDLLRARIRRDTAVVYVSHNLGVVAQVADRVAVLYAGEVVEEAAVAQLFAAPLHPYTRGLLACLPRVGAVRKGVPLPSIAGRMPAPGEGPPGCAFAPRCSIVEAACETLVPGLEAAGAGRRVRCLRWPALVDGTVSPSAAVPGRPSGTRPAPEGHDPPPGQRPGDGAPVLAVRDLEVSFAVPRGAPQALRRRRGSAVAAVNGVDLTVARGETVALVGESGSGKTTVAAAIVGLLCPDGGSVTLQGRRLAPGLGGRSRGDRGRIQMVFQDPEEALNPYRTVGSTLARSIRLRPGGDPGIRSRVEHLLAAVGLAPYMADRWPGQLSGGEKQRVALARGLAPSPLVMLLDEPLSSLDVSVQAALLNT
ncbi:MAG: oligopeptide/dipeptide ABC transporter ATP-binding protein, partial [Anaerolineae bacterium]